MTIPSSNMWAKIVALVVLALVIVGSVWALAKPSAPETVEGNWQLAFDLPEGWFMVRPYSLTPNFPISTDVKRKDSEVWLQNSAEKVGNEGDDYLRIGVIRFDAGKSVPEGAKDLGDGFYEGNVCAEGTNCLTAGMAERAFFFKNESGLYKFSIWADGERPTDEDMAKAKDIIMSAKQVTDFTDVPATEVKTR